MNVDNLEVLNFQVRVEPLEWWDYNRAFSFYPPKVSRSINVEVLKFSV